MLAGFLTPIRFVKPKSRAQGVDPLSQLNLGQKSTASAAAFLWFRE
jgi:hypothetical protein